MTGAIVSGQLWVLSSMTVRCGAVLVAAGQGVPSGLLGTPVRANAVHAWVAG